MVLGELLVRGAGTRSKRQPDVIPAVVHHFVGEDIEQSNSFSRVHHFPHPFKLRQLPGDILVIESRSLSVRGLRQGSRR